MNKCKICASEYCAEIDSLLDSGEFKKTVAAQFNVSYPALVRHAARHGKNAPAPATEISDLAKEAETWRIRANQAWEQSVAEGDRRGQTQSLAVALRGLELAYKQAERDAEAAPAAGTGGVNLEEIDRIMQDENAKSPRGRAFEKLYTAPDAVVEMAARLADHPHCWPTVETILLSESTRVN